MEDKIIEETTSEVLLPQLKDRYRLDTTIQVKRGTFSDDYILAEGEPGYHITTHEFKLGDGVTTWDKLPLANELYISSHDLTEAEVTSQSPVELKNQLDAEVQSGATAGELQNVVSDFYQMQANYDEAYGNKFTVQHAGVDNPDAYEIRVGGQSVYSAKKELIGNVTDEVFVDIIGGANDPIVSYSQPTLHGIKNYVLGADIFKTDRETTNTAFGIDINSNLNNMTTHDILRMMLYPPIRHKADSGSFKLFDTKNVIGSGKWCNTPSASTIYKKGIYKTFSDVSCTITRGSEAISQVELYLTTSATNDSDKSLLIAYFDVTDGGTVFKPYIRKLDATEWVRAKDNAGKDITITTDNILKTGSTITLTFNLWNWIVNTHFKNFEDGTVNEANVKSFWQKFVAGDKLWSNLHTKGDSKVFVLDVKSETSNSSKINYHASSITSNSQFINPLYYGYFKAPAVTNGSYNLLSSADWRMPKSDDPGGNLGGVTEMLAGVGTRTLGFIVPTNTYIAYLFPRSNTVKSIEDLEVNVNADNAFEKNMAVSVTVLDHSITIDESGMAVYADTTKSEDYYICIYKSPVNRAEGLGKVGNTYDYKFIY